MSVGELEVRTESHWRPSADPLSPQLASSIDAPEEPHPGRRGRFPAELLACLQKQPRAKGESFTSSKIDRAPLVPGLMRVGWELFIAMRRALALNCMSGTAELVANRTTERCSRCQPRPRVALWT